MLRRITKNMPFNSGYHCSSGYVFHAKQQAAWLAVFNGATGAQLGTQSVGIYFGNGDQNNYFKFVLHANNGSPGFKFFANRMVLL